LAPVAKARLVETYGKLPLSFEANQGQTDGRVKFLSRGSGYTLFLTGNEAVISLKSRPSFPQGGISRQLPGRPRSKVERGESTQHSSLLPLESFLPTPDSLFAASPSPVPSPESRAPSPAVLRMKVVGANPAAKAVGLDELPGKSNYFIGNDPKKWRTNVPNYAKVKYEGVYPGVDLVYYGNAGKLEYDFVVAPGADPKAIALEVGADGVRPTTERVTPPEGERRSPLQIAANGDLVIGTGGGEVRFHKPVVYQPKDAKKGSPHSEFTIHNSELLDVKYVLTAQNEIRFEVGAYDRSRPLVIDPVLSYSTYLGGSGDDGASSVKVDSSGCIYLTGWTYSSDFPTASPLQAGNAGDYDVFVTKLNAAGDAVIYSTYLGGSQQDYANSIAVDSSGNAYLTGRTESLDFPTANPLQAYYGGGWSDAFVAKLNPAGSALVYSTYLGGDRYPGPFTGLDEGMSIAVDSSGNAFVAGYTGSFSFPTANPFQDSNNSTHASPADADAFVAKLNPSGSALVYSTYLGGRDSDYATGIAVDSLGSAYIVGTADCWDTLCGIGPFPTTAGSFQPSSSDESNTDTFVTKLDPAGSALVYSTFLAGSIQDGCEIDIRAGFYQLGCIPSIAIDSSGNAYVTGLTCSSDFPTRNPLQPANAGGCDAFVTKLNPTGSDVVYSTYLGGSGPDTPWYIAVDSAGNVYVAGQTFSPDFPTSSPLQAVYAGGGDVFVAELNPSGSALLFSTYLGGSGDDGAGSVALDSSGNIYLAGWTSSPDFPSASPLQANYGGGPWDAFVAKIVIDNTPLGSPTVQPADTTTGTSPVMLSFSDVTQAGETSLTSSTAGEPPPTGFQLGSPATYYDLTTTAEFSGSITVCISYAGVTFSSGAQPQLYHFQGGAWVDVTTSVDTANQIVCGSVTSLSPFAVFAPAYLAAVQPPIGADGLSVFSAKRGVVPVKFTLSLGGNATCQLPAATISVFRVSGSTQTAVNETVYTLQSDGGSSFRIDATNCQYVYNLATKSIGSGTYKVNISIGGNAVGSAMFGLQ